MNSDIKTFKICHLTSVHKADDIRIFLKECCSLAKKNSTVFLIAPNAKTGDDNGVHVIGVKNGNENRLLRMTFTVWSVLKSAFKCNADIYHLHDPELLPAGLLLKIKGKKVIYDVHEDVPRQILDKYWIHKYIRFFISFFFELFENKAAARLNFIVTATPYIQKRFLKVNQNTENINNYPFINELETHASWKNKKREICYVGGITDIRGISPLIDAIDEVDNLILNLAGEYSPLSFKDQLKNKNGWKKVNEFGFVSRKVTSEIMAKSKAGIVTFLPMANHVNAQPNKIFEYMAAGIPVVASHFPLWKEIVEKNNCGICVDPLDSKKISEAINYILDHDKEAELMGKNGKLAVESKYNWAIEEKKLYAVYNQLS